MKCTECPSYTNNICQFAQSGKLSEMDNLSCLLRIQIMLLRDIWCELAIDNDEKEDGDWWK